MKALLRSAALAAVLVPGLAHAFDVDHATARYLALLTPAARARSDAYFDGRLWVDAGGTLVTVAICWLILFSGALVTLRDAMRRRGWRPWVIMIAVSAAFLAALTVLNLPWSIAMDYFRERQFGLMNQSLGAWLGDQAIEAAMTLVVGALLLTIINAVMRAFPRRWWLIGMGVVGAFTVLLTLVEPVFITPLFNTYTDLPAGPLRTRIEAMAAMHQIPTDHIVVFDASRQSDRISANVSGIGPTVRISLTDNLVKRATVPEAAAVVGHEMGHYVLHHIWWGIVFITLLAGVELWLVARLGPLLQGGWIQGMRGIDDPAALPVLVGAITLLSLLFLPVTNSFSRIDESAADAFGLETAREPDGFALTAMKLANYRKIAPPAWEEALFYDHPSGRTRVHMAMQWKADHVPNATETVPPSLTP